MLEKDLTIKGMCDELILKKVLKEFSRQGVDQESERFKRCNLKKHRMSKHIDMFETVIVPAELQEDIIIRSSFSRVNGRFPALSYFNRETKAAIWRSSELQQLQLISRNTDDEDYLNAISRGPKEGQELFVFNQGSKEVKALQVENTAHYKSISIIYYNFNALWRITQGFEKMWSMSNRFQKSKKKAKFLSKIEKSLWFANIDQILKYAFKVKLAIEVRLLYESYLQ